MLRRSSQTPTLLLGVTTPTSFLLLDGLPQYLAAQGWQVHLVSSHGQAPVEMTGVPGVERHEIPMRREPAPAWDVLALLRWVVLVAQIRPSVLSSGTPKAGLLGLLAGWFLRVPRRIYHLRGLRLETETGLRLQLFKQLEKLTCFCATDVLAVSPSLRDRVISLGLAPSVKVSVLGDGSSNGVDTLRFRPNSMSDGQKIALAAGLGLAPNTPTIGYVGRLNADKGLNVLAESSAILHRRGFDHQLLIVGEVDGGFSDPWAATDQLKKVSPVVTGFVGDTAPYYQLMDVFCLPTFREGFPNVVLEAGASGCPTVTTTATGAKDSVVDGVTGRLVAAGDAAGLADALMETLRGTGSLMGLRAREHVVARYDRQRIWNLTSAFYKRNN